FTITALGLAWDLARFQLLDIVPVARELLIENMQDAVVVLDAHDRVVDLNPAAQRIIGRTASQAVGAPAEQALDAWRGLVDRYAHVVEANEEVAYGEGVDKRWLDLHISPLVDSRGRMTGRLIVSPDISD
ncbi:MAG: PAS domain-containing protein, partial [Chloroflexi bacterium]|nr:PAS domain-containing protein [Chloroflexota bacterium]